MKIKQKITLCLLAVAGSIMTFFIVNIFILKMSFITYISIEFVISLMHALYNKAKVKIIKP